MAIKEFLQQNTGRVLSINNAKIMDWSFVDGAIPTLDYLGSKVAIIKAIDNVIISKSLSIIRSMKTDKNIIQRMLTNVISNGYFDDKIICGYVPKIYFGFGRYYGTIHKLHTHVMNENTATINGGNIVCNIRPVKEYGAMEEMCPWIVVYKNTGDLSRLPALMNVINSSHTQTMKPSILHSSGVTAIACSLPALFNLSHLAIEL